MPAFLLNYAIREQTNTVQPVLCMDMAVGSLKWLELIKCIEKQLLLMISLLYMLLCRHCDSGLLNQERLGAHHG